MFSEEAEACRLQIRLRKCLSSSGCLGMIWVAQGELIIQSQILTGMMLTRQKLFAGIRPDNRGDIGVK